MIQDSFTRGLEYDLIEQFDNWHKEGEVWDADLDRQIHLWFAEEKAVFPKRPYFSPSSVTACPQGLYFKYLGATQDKFERQPHQSRWAKIGTAVGDMLQREILFMEKHYERVTGVPPKFIFDRNELGQPAFEGFVKKAKEVQGAGESFYLFGAPDGIMLYEDEDGEVHRVGVEFKTKQTTAARTSLYSMREAELGHVRQTIAYSIMYDLDYYVVVYQNASKKTWKYDDEEYDKTPDLRAFSYRHTEEDKQELLEELGGLLKRFKADDKPKLDLTEWTFNNYKTVCATNLTEEEYADLVAEAEAVQESKEYNAFQKKQYREAIEELTMIRKHYKG